MSESWEQRVRFAAGQAYAYRPSEVLVHSDGTDDDLIRVRSLADEELNRIGRGREVSRESLRGGATRYRAEVDVPQAVQRLRTLGVTAQPNHVLFASPFSGNPFSGNPFSGNPFSGNPFSGNPFSGNPFSGNPFSGNPFSGNPFSGNPFSGNPADVAYATPHPQLDREFARTGRGPCLARPAQHAWTHECGRGGKSAIVVGVLDVGFPEPGQRPMLISGCAASPVSRSPETWAVWDEDAGTVLTSGAEPVGLGFLDRVAGHGMFVAGRIAQADPECRIIVRHVLRNSGDGDELTVANALLDMAEGSSDPVDIVNLSFGGYTLDDMPMLAKAVAILQSSPGPASNWYPQAPAEDHGVVVVTSAGNDGVDRAPYPAALPGVVSVAALGPGGPAAFSNWGSWVSACAPGVDVLSAFFTDIDANQHPEATGDPDRFRGAARWSGTSFAAPWVAGRIAKVAREQGVLPKAAARMLLDEPDAALPGFGAIIT